MAVALGGRYQLHSDQLLAASYTHLQFPRRTMRGRASSPTPLIALLTRRVDGGGRYTQRVGILNANVLFAH